MRSVDLFGRVFAEYKRKYYSNATLTDSAEVVAVLTLVEAVLLLENEINGLRNDYEQVNSV